MENEKFISEHGGTLANQEVGVMVTILLATLNGEDYLKAQLESIAAQTYENWQLVVGDDGSTDHTLDILEEFKKQHPNQVTIMKNDPPTGSAKNNFINLLRNSYGPHFMFCDQDDVWKPDKIYLTLQKMEALETRYGEKTPILVHTDLSVADENLEMIAESFFQYADIPKRIYLNQLIVQNSVTGCTVMINRCLQQYFLQLLPVSKIIMHDYWAALIAKVFGKIGFVNEPTMYYRQHGHNSVGAKHAGNPVYLYQRLREGKNTYRRMMIESMEQIQGFVSVYGEDIENLDVYELLNTYGDLYYKGKIRRLAFYKNYHVLKEGNIRKLMQWLWG